MFFSVGGLVGYSNNASSNNPNQILNSFSMGSITNTTGKTGSMTAGGLIGDQPSIRNKYYHTKLFFCDEAYRQKNYGR